MDTSLDELNRLNELRVAVQKSIEQASGTLIWFTQQLKTRRRIPLNIWRRLDRPLPKESQTFGLAFDLWHAILRSERALRLSSQDTASSLRSEVQPVEKALDELTSIDSQEPKECYARRLTSDEIYGTFNALSAASVLRWEKGTDLFSVFSV